MLYVVLVSCLVVIPLNSYAAIPTVSLEVTDYEYNFGGWFVADNFFTVDSFATATVYGQGADLRGDTYAGAEDGAGNSAADLVSDSTRTYSLTFKNCSEDQSASVTVHAKHTIASSIAIPGGTASASNSFLGSTNSLGFTTNFNSTVISSSALLPGSTMTATNAQNNNVVGSGTQTGPNHNLSVTASQNTNATNAVIVPIANSQTKNLNTSVDYEKIYILSCEQTITLTTSSTAQVAVSITELTGGDTNGFVTESANEISNRLEIGNYTVTSSDTETSDIAPIDSNVSVIDNVGINKLQKNIKYETDGASVSDATVSQNSLKFSLNPVQKEGFVKLWLPPTLISNFNSMGQHEPFKLKVDNDITEVKETTDKFTFEKIIWIPINVGTQTIEVFGDVPISKPNYVVEPNISLNEESVKLYDGIGNSIVINPDGPSVIADRNNDETVDVLFMGEKHALEAGELITATVKEPETSSIIISPSVVSHHSQTMFTGSNFESNSPINFTLNGIPILKNMEILSSEDGQFTYHYTTPQYVPGPYVLKASDNIGNEASTTLRILPTHHCWNIDHFIKLQ